MELHLDISLGRGYKSNSQIARLMTENWVLNNSYCPCCGNINLNGFENNRPAADFYCNRCNEEFELKSKVGKLSNIVNDGAYSTMIERISSDSNPNFFFLTYTHQWTVSNFMIIPKHFFTPDIIKRRPPLKETARRAGWIGCNIDISKVTDLGKVFLVKNAQIVNPITVNESFSKTLFLRKESQEARGWILDVMNCVQAVNKENFTLDDVYKFETQLKVKHPDNNFIKDKIRQQLQLLRDKGIVEFVGRGNYRALK